MVSVDMGFDDPLNRQSLRFNLSDQFIRVIVGDPACRVVDVHHAVDDGAGSARRVFHDIADRVRRLVKEGLNTGFDVHIYWIVSHAFSP